MKHRRHSFLRPSFALAILFVAISSLNAQTLSCRPGASPQWGSGWCDFSTPVNFKKGERLRLAVGGSAKKVIVRLLQKGGDATTPNGVIPTAFPVPESRFLEITVPSDLRSIVQISVHGGPSPWNQYPLGAQNGLATITGVERLSAPPAQAKKKK
jgi:hypothetical protein